MSRKVITKRVKTMCANLLALKVQADFINERMEKYKEQLRDYEGFTITIPNQGKVVISKEGGGILKDVIYLDVGKFNELSTTRQKNLIKAGVVVKTQELTNLRKPSVTIKPNV